MKASELAALIDHTLLHPGAALAQIERLCDEALEDGFCSVCVHPIWVPSVAAKLIDSSVKICTVVAFAHGESMAEAKAHEARLARAAGAEEIDVVAARSLIHAGDWKALRDELTGVVDAVPGALVKVIVESASLSREELIGACKVVRESGAHFIKTSTGFGAGGASLEAVRVMREQLGPEFGVKASGGIRDTASALAMIEAGANRLGCSAGVAIVRGLSTP